VTSNGGVDELLNSVIHEVTMHGHEEVKKRNLDACSGTERWKLLHCASKNTVYLAWAFVW